MDVTIQLPKLKLKDVAEILSISDDDLALKLLSMGCIPGERISVERKALFGDPILVRTESSLLSLRKTDASKIIVKKTTPDRAK